MKIKKNILTALLVISLLTTIIFGVNAAEVTTLRFTSGGLGGSWYQIAAGIMALVGEKDPTIKLDVVPGAGLENAPRVGSKEADMAMSNAPIDKWAFDGTTPFTEAYPDLRGGLKGLGFSVSQFLVTQDTGLKTIDEFINQKYPLNLLVEPIGSADPLMLFKILGFYGIDDYTAIEKWGGSVKFMGYEDQIVYMKDRHANASYASVAAPSAAVEEMIFAKLDLRLLKLSDELVNFLVEKSGCSEKVISKDTYEFMEEDLKTAAIECSIIFNKDVPEDVVYSIIKTLCENKERVESLSPSLVNRFNPGPDSFANLGIPLHPGAEKYYKEVGWIK